MNWLDIGDEQFFTPLQEPPASIDEEYVKQFITRCLYASYQPPHSFSSTVINSATLLKILRKATHICSLEQNIVDVIVPLSGTVHVFGDLHGDIHSIVSGLKQTGLPSSENKLVFAGDYVDRGPWGVEVVLIVCLLKIWQPLNVQILRGNHETTGCISRYGFEDEVKYKFSSKAISSFVSLFRQLPLVAIIRNLSEINGPTSHDSSSSSTNNQKKKKKNTRNTRKQSAKFSPSSKYSWSVPLTPGEKRIITMHGGLFRSEESRKEGKNDIARLTELNEVNRNIADPYGDMLEDVLWSDPQVVHNGVLENHLRGCAILFGQATVEHFFEQNHIHGILRAHEGPDMRSMRPEMNDIQKGYSVDMEMLSGFVATVFSAANYSFQDPKQNKAAFATIFGKRHPDMQSTASLPKFTTFDRYKPPPKNEVHLFYTGEASCCTPRQSMP